MISEYFEEITTENSNKSSYVAINFVKWANVSNWKVGQDLINLARWRLNVGIIQISHVCIFDNLSKERQAFVYIDVYIRLEYTKCVQSDASLLTL